MEERLTFSFIGEDPLPKSDESNEKPASIVSLALPSFIFFSMLLSSGYGSTEKIEINYMKFRSSIGISSSR